MKKEDIVFSMIDMKSVLESVIGRLKSQIDDTSASISIQESLMNCHGYASWIEEVWFNYLSNAVKYGGESPNIEICSELVNNEYIKYSVIDNGLGISDEMKAVIFEDTNELKNKSAKGMGLGLSIVRQIMTKLDGYVEVESEEGKGSTFSFFLRTRN